MYILCIALKKKKKYYANIEHLKILFKYAYVLALNFNIHRSKCKINDKHHLKTNLLFKNLLKMYNTNKLFLVFYRCKRKNNFKLVSG